jgi:hypothetical protein
VNRNHLPGAITCHDGIVRVNLDVFNGYKQVELCRNHNPIAIYFLANDDGQQLPALTLEQLKALKDTFLEYLGINKDLKISKKDYESRIGLFIKWLEESNIQPISPEHWQGYYAHLKSRLNQKDLSPTTVRNYFRNLNNFAVWLVEKGHLPANPLEGIKPPQPLQKTIRSKAISVEDIVKYLPVPPNGPRSRTRNSTHTPGGMPLDGTPPKTVCLRGCSRKYWDTSQLKQLRFILTPTKRLSGKLIISIPLSKRTAN